MLPLQLRTGIDYWLGKAQVFCGATVIVFGASLKGGQTGYQWIDMSANVLQPWAWLVAGAGPLVVAGLQFARKKCGDPRTWRLVQEVVDEYREVVFEGLKDDDHDCHRVTLFKHCWLHHRSLSNWPPKRWFRRLIPVARSGHLAKDGICTFWAPDAGERCEGVAGKAYRRRTWVEVRLDEPDINAATNQDDSASVLRVAKTLYVDPTWLQSHMTRGKQISRCYAAVAVLVKGRPWGVIVLDSQRPAAIEVAKLEEFKHYARRLTPLLEKI